MLQLICVNQLMWISREKLTRQAVAQVYVETHKLINLFLSKLGSLYALRYAQVTPKSYFYTP